MKLDRRTFVVAASALVVACEAPAPRRSTSRKPMARVVQRPLSSLPTTTLPWLELRDHFVATVGPHAGTGRPLGPLLVLADATFAPHSRFPLHPHEEMEILSIVLDGELSHHGDQAHGATLSARSAQLISARSGMRHAEGNDTDRATRMLQIWFSPTSFGGEPAYFQRTWAGRGRNLVAGDDVMPLRADAKVWWIDVPAGGRERVHVASGKTGYLVALDGAVEVHEAGERRASLERGEGAQVDAGELDVTASSPCAVLWIELG